MTAALRSSTRVREVWSVGGPFPLPASRFPTCKIFNSKFEIRNSKSPFSALRFSSFEFRISNSGLIPEPLNPLTPSRRHRGRAFSLVELLAVVGIIAILSVAAVPVMRGLGGSQSSRATAQILISALEQARTVAVLSGTNALLALPDAGTTTMNPTNHLRTYAIIRPTVDLDGNGRDDFQTNTPAPGWVLLSKWERLPGDLIFSSAVLAQLGSTNPSGLVFPANSNSSSLRYIGFTPSGSLSQAAGTSGLLFASSNKVVNGIASVADRIEISQFSGRVRYAGLVTNTNF